MLEISHLLHIKLFPSFPALRSLSFLLRIFKMQLTSFILGLSASVAFAAPTENGATQDLAERTLQDLDAAFDHIFTGLDKLNADVIAFSGPVDAAKLEASNKAIEEAINQGGVAIKASKSMSIPELLNILDPVTVMQNAVAETVNTLGKYKNKLTAAKVDVLSMLTRDRAAADSQYSMLVTIRKCSNS